MKKLLRLDKNYYVIIAFCLTALFISIPENCIFGSQIDWASQHIVFPKYFRNLFYETGNLFPNFSLSLGAGQNIYNFSYYGLLNPIILISYLLPFIDMTNYIIIANTLLYILFGLIMYYFLKTHFKNDVSLLTTLIILCAAPILYHFHKHFMFVDYLPFLVLGLIGTDKYFKNGNRSLLAISVFLIIMISYYYSVFSIGVLCIYALYKYLEKTDKVTIKSIISEAFKYLFPVFIGVLMSSILLLPTIYVLKTGRSDLTKTIDLVKLLSPTFNLDAILYSNYSLGLTSIAVISLLYLFFSKKKEDRYLVYIFLIIISIPIFIYLLNGMLYFRNKVLIPFIPLFGIIIGKFLSLIFQKKVSFFNIIIITIISISVSVLCMNENYVFYADILLVILVIYFYLKGYTNKKLFSLILLLVPIITLLVSNGSDIYVEGNYLSKDESKVNKEIEDVLKKENNIVRFNNLEDTLRNVNEVYITNYNQNFLYSSVSNNLYKDFYKKIFHNALSYRNNLVLSQNNDILFQTFMGVKYIYAKDDVPTGYNKISKNVYKNDNVLPMFYGISSLTNEKIFNKLIYPYNIGTLLNSVVVKDNSTKDVTNTIEEINLDYEIEKQENLTIDKRDNYVRIKSKDNGKLVLKLNKDLNKDILIIKFKLKHTPSCNKGDASISINGITNVLTCKEWVYKNRNKTFNYVISSNDNTNELNVEFVKNNYDIENIKIYQLKYDDLVGIKDNLSEFIIDKEKSTDEDINGYINMKENGYFVTSIPYDKGFRVYVDDKLVKKEIVNKAFLGFKLDKGGHHIRIKYTSPLFKEGVVLSIIGIFLFIMVIIYDRRKLIYKNK